MNKSESITKLSEALSAFQGEVTNPPNTADNPFFKSKYAPLNDILNLVRPLLKKHGLSIIQMPGGDGENVTMTTVLLHKSGEFIESEPLTLPSSPVKGKYTAQGAGSAITYGRRYSLSAVLGISSEDDDDGNAEKRNGKKEPPKSSPEPQPKTGNPRGAFFAQLQEWAKANVDYLEYKVVEETAKAWMRKAAKVDSLSEIKESEWRAIVKDRMHVVFNAVEGLLLDDAMEGEQ